MFEAGGCSDHQRCRFVVKEEEMKPRKPFKFVNALVDSPEFFGLWKAFGRRQRLSLSLRLLYSDYLRNSRH